MLQKKTKMSKVICLNVGGSKFYSTKDTLKQAPYFDALTKYHDIDEEIFIDRDGTHFRFILNYIRGSNVLPETHMQLEELYIEADFYSLGNLKNLISSKLKSDVFKLKSSTFYLKQIWQRLN